MQHITDDDLVLKYYGEAAGDDDHLDSCPECRSRYRELQSVLNMVELPVPARPAAYEQQVWARVASKIEPGKRRLWSGFEKWVAAVAMGCLAVAAFTVGRLLPVRQQPAGAPASERVLVVAIGGHLLKSQAVLAEIVNAEPAEAGIEIGEEREAARSLLDDNRLYRTAAQARGDAGTAFVLDELERVLLDIAHSPESLSNDDIESIRSRVRQQGLMFKLRVVESNLQNEPGVSEKL